MYDASYVSIAHSLMALAMDHRYGKQLRSQASASPDRLKDVVQAILGSQSGRDQKPEGTYESLEK